MTARVPQTARISQPARVAPLSPAAGAITAPLQAYAWTGHATAPRDHWGAIAAHRLGIHGYDRGLPRPVRFAWTATAPLDPAATFTLLIARRPDGADPVVRRPVGRATAADVAHLWLDTCYYWFVEIEINGRAQWRSPAVPFRTHARPPRWIHAPGITNLRDLGGWPLPDGRRVRQGLIYRSSEMNGHVTLQPAGRRVLEDELGLRTDLDLRGDGEPAAPVLDPDRVHWIQVPIRPYGEMLHADQAAGYRRIFEILADPARHPLLFHCWGGADRAGTVAHLLLAVLGVASEGLRQDYELTTQSIWGERREDSNAYRALRRALAGFAPAGAPPRRQAEGFLRAIGVAPGTLTALRRRLIEPRSKGVDLGFELAGEAPGA